MAVHSSPFKSDLSQMHHKFPALKEGTAKGRAEKWDPKPFHENSSTQEALHCASIRDPQRLALAEQAKTKWSDKKKQFLVSDDIFATLSDPVETASHYEDLIQHHVAFRVAHFFQQSLVCFNTPFHFEIASTEGQFFTAPKLKVVSRNKQSQVIDYQAAHSSTIPGLNACLRSDYARFKKDTSKKEPVYFSFLKGAHVEVLGNSTVGLPKFVNQIDTLIDGKAATDGLRKPTIALLNEVAKGVFTPMEATRQFIDLLDKNLQTRVTKSKAMTPAKIKVVEIYREQVAQIRELAEVPDNTEEQRPLFDYLLNVNVSIENPDDVSTIRSIVYERKFEIIRESQFTESRIQQIVDEIFPKLSQEKKHFLKISLTYSAGNSDNLRKIFQKLFAVSLPALKVDKKLCLSLKSYYKKNKVVLDDALRTIRLVIRNYNKLENSFQSMLLREFRTTLRGLKQKDLASLMRTEIDEQIAQEYTKAIPDFRTIAALSSLPASQATVSRLENSRIHIIKNFKSSENQRRKELSLEMAQVIAKVLDVQTGHFFCSFFASRES